MANVSRRGFLIAAAGCATVAGRPASAASGDGPSAGPIQDAPASPPACIPVTQPPDTATASGQQGTVSASVGVTNLNDVVAIYYTITNTSDASDTYTVYYTDQVTSLQSAQFVTDLDSGESFTGLMHGSLNHDFVFTVALSNGTTLTLGPVGELPTCGPTHRKYPKPIYGPKKIHQSALQSSGSPIGSRGLSGGPMGLFSPPPGR